MANILITHFSGVIYKGEYQSSCFYDGLIEGLREAGHHCMQILTSEFLARPWNGNNTPIFTYIKEHVLESIKNFDPDLVISFNNSSVEGIENAVNCPIAFWDADSFQFFNDKDKIKKNADRYHYMAFSEYGVKDYIKNLNIPSSLVCRVPSATAIKSIPEEKQYNISFIGNPFFASRNLTDLLLTNPNLIALKEENFNLNGKNIKKILDHFGVSPSALQHYQSGEMRAKLVSILLDEGIRIFGPNEWLQLAPFASKIIQAYDPRLVYSLKHNELIYNRSKVSLSVSHTQNITGYPWRVLDILASSSVLVSDFKSDLANDFSKRIDLQCYQSYSEVLDISKKVLNDPKMRSDLVQQQNAAIEENYKWKHRFSLIQQLTGVNLNPNKERGQYTLFRFERNKLDNVMYQAAIYLLKPKKAKKIKRKLIRLNYKKWVLMIMKSFIPHFCQFLFYKARLNYLNEKIEYQ